MCCVTRHAPPALSLVLKIRIGISVVIFITENERHTSALSVVLVGAQGCHKVSAVTIETGSMFDIMTALGKLDPFG